MSNVKLKSIDGDVLSVSRNKLKSFSTDNDKTIYTMMCDILNRNERDVDIMKLEANKTWNCFISLNMTVDTEDAIKAFIDRNIESMIKNSTERVPVSRGK